MAVSKKVRFEVFKRDSFTCQYCGKSAPDVVLHVDHIEPVSKGGADDVMNLITSCSDCNLGKGARRLSDDTVIAKQKAQLDELQDRREQLEAMLDWQKELAVIERDAVPKIGELWEELVPGSALTDVGIEAALRLLRKYGVLILCDAMRAAVLKKVVCDDEGKPTSESANDAWDYIPRIAAMKVQDASDPDLKDALYIRGIVRKRLYCNEPVAIMLAKDALACGIPADELKDWAKTAHSWTEWSERMENLIRREKANDA